MKISNLVLTNFRNYKKQQIYFNDGVNIFVGDNGSGKTNLLEAIYFLSLTKSYKTNDINIIKYDKDFARIEASITKKERKDKLKVIVTENGKKALINNQEIKRLSDYIGIINVISFLPEDIMLIKGSPKERRYFIDSVYGQIDHNYLHELSSFRLLLKQRNELLKKLSETINPDLTLLDVLTEQLATSMKILVGFRTNFVNKINNSLEKVYKFLANEEKRFVFKYKPSLESNFENMLKNKYKNDLYLKTTNLGPHRDDYIFLINDLFVKDNSSQGEQRIIILALILAIGDIVYNQINERPIFLLDDVFSELDSIRQNRLIKYLLKLQAQAIITTTELMNVQETILKNSSIFRVKNNTIREEYNNE